MKQIIATAISENGFLYILLTAVDQHINLILNAFVKQTVKIIYLRKQILLLIKGPKSRALLT